MINYLKLLCISLLGLGLLTFDIRAYAQSKEEPTLVIFDTDMGNDIDDALALDMLMKYMDQGKMKVLGIMNNKGSVYATRLIDILCTWYGYPRIPIGKIDDGVAIDDYVDYAKRMVEYNNHQGVYKMTKLNHDDLLPAHLLYRKLLARQADQSVVVISVGFSTNLARLLDTKADKYSKLDGKSLVEKKVKVLSIMAGSFGPSKRAEFNVVHDIPAAQQVFRVWPSTIVLLPFEVGQHVHYTSESIEHDFNWTKHHPLVDAYKLYREFPYDRPTWDLTAVYYAANPSDNLFEHSSCGNLSVDDQGFTHFEEYAKGRHFVLSLPKENREVLKQYFIDIIKQKPKKFK